MKEREAEDRKADRMAQKGMQVAALKQKRAEEDSIRHQQDQVRNVQNKEIEAASVCRSVRACLTLPGVGSCEAI